MLDLSRRFRLTLALSLALAAPALAQETAPATPPATDAPAADAPAADAPAAADDLSMGQEVAAGPETYIKSTHGDWQLRCIRATDGSDPCEIYQLLKDKDANAVAEISVAALPEGQEAVAGATVMVPLETLLQPGLRMAIDTNKPKAYPFAFCAKIGCLSRVGFTAPEVETLKKGAKATISVVPAAAPDKLVSVDVSLKGFTEAYDAVRAELPKKE